MTEKKSYQSWTISDELWNVIKDEIPQKKRDPEKVYKNKPGQGRKPMDARKALTDMISNCLKLHWMEL